MAPGTTERVVLPSGSVTIKEVQVGFENGNEELQATNDEERNPQKGNSGIAVESNGKQGVYMELTEGTILNSSPQGVQEEAGALKKSRIGRRKAEENKVRELRAQSRKQHAGLSVTHEADQAGPSTMDQAVPSNMYRPDASNMYHYGPSTMNQAGPSTIDQPDPSTMYQAGPSSMYQGGPSAMNQAGPSTINQPDPSTIYQAGPSNMNQAGPSTMNQAGPSTINQPDPSTIYQGGPSNMNQAGPSTTYHPGPTTMDHAGSSTLYEAGPSTAYKAGSHTHNQKFTGYVVKFKAPAQDVKEDSDATVELKYHQVGVSFAQDEFYHYEDVDDFDDMPKEPDVKPKHSGKAGKGFTLHRLHEGFPCCKHIRRDMTLSSCLVIRQYFVDEVAKGLAFIKCCCYEKCGKYYDVRDVLSVIGNKGDKKNGKRSGDTKDLTRDDNLGLKQGCVKLIHPLECHDNVTKEATTSTNHETVESDVLLERPVTKRKTKWQRWREFGKEKEKTSSPECPKKKRKSRDRKRKYQSEENQEMTMMKEQMQVQTENSCTICFDCVEKELLQCSNKCGHSTCRECLKCYFLERLELLDPELECPYHNCSEKFDPTVVLEVLEEENLKARYLKMTLEIYLIRNGETRHCPGERCSYAVLSPNGKCPIDCQNEECGTKFCSECQQPWGSANHECKDGYKENWMKAMNNVKPCPACSTPIMKLDDGSCNYIYCRVCKVTFCWLCLTVCNEGIHMLHCSLFGNTIYGPRRRIANYVGYGLAIAVGVPVTVGILLGVGCTIGAGLITAGIFSPPVLLAKEVYERERRLQTSPLRRCLAVAGGLGLGLVGIPFLSCWGVYKTFSTALVAFDHKLDKVFGEYDDDNDMKQQQKRDETQRDKKPQQDRNSQETSGLVASGGESLSVNSEKVSDGGHHTNTIRESEDRFLGSGRAKI